MSPCLTMGALGARPLLDEPAFDEPVRPAIRAVRQELARVLDDPAGYHAVAEHAGNLVIVELWPSRHASDDACVDVARRNEKSRIVTYDLEQRRILATRWAADDTDGADAARPGTRPRATPP